MAHTDSPQADPDGKGGIEVRLVPPSGEQQRRNMEKICNRNRYTTGSCVLDIQVRDWANKKTFIDRFFKRRGKQLVSVIPLGGRKEPKTQVLIKSVSDNTALFATF